MTYKKLKLWFDDSLATMLSEKIIHELPSFNAQAFIAEVTANLDVLELKDRVEVFADKLHDFLGKEYASNIDVLIKILGPENLEETGMFTQYFWIMPIAKYVEKYGLNHFEVSMIALAEITKRNTSEYAIRAYLNKYPDLTLCQMIKWSKSTNFHLRRLGSEGVRPRLPWAKKLDRFIENPTPILPILHNLRYDPVKFVQKSVANCVHDILKDNYTIGMELLKSWTIDAPPSTTWIIKHALRGEIKKGNLEAKVLVGQ